MLELVQPYKSTMPEGIELPSFVPSPEDLASVGLKTTATNSEFLKALCNAGVKRFGINKLPNKQVYYDRVRYELETLEKLKLVDYMLLVWDFVNWAAKRNIPLGAARGSAAGSLVCYLSGITRKVDPIKYKLYFERFISIDRVQPFEKDGKVYLKDCADIDVDISYFRRPEVLKYLAEKYNGNTAKILNIQTMSGKAAIKSSIKIVEEATEDQANAASNKVEKTFGVVAALKDMYDEDEDFRAWADEHKKTYKIARKIENLNKNFSVHASGVAIAAGEMLASFPVQNTKDGETITAWDMEVIGGICVKVDCLGIKTLDLLDICEKESGVLMSSVDPEDPSIYKQFQDLNHKYGLFQVETDAGFRITKMIKPNRFDQLSDIVAINRPGALAALPDYIAYSSGEKPIPKLHPIIDDVLKDTCGVLLMQEQVMRILHEVYKFTLIEANVLRKIIGKKKREEVGAWEEKIKTRGAEVGISTSITDWYWNTIKASADYQFNACLALDTVVETKDGDKLISDVKIGDHVRAYDVKGKADHYVEVLNKHSNTVELFEIELEDGRKITASMDHKFLCSDMEMRPLREIIKKDLQIVTD